MPRAVGTGLGAPQRAGAPRGARRSEGSSVRRWTLTAPATPAVPGCPRNHPAPPVAGDQQIVADRWAVSPAPDPLVGGPGESWVPATPPGGRGPGRSGPARPRCEPRSEAGAPPAAPATAVAPAAGAPPAARAAPAAS